ncbi:hypothetical protein BDN70DRAFT_830346 [Pholiota conissans]|uniref:Thioredoxin-like fold domain-containing protein n=1 Tax=Pholiota conissans TaxID=109636 RepID=A0A9P5Z5D7_9AGAR|nr:hypothetical protein BDN70DRAFT_830346 [Pholiota conissans]
MKLLSSSALALIALATSANAEYFSAGWTPGQKAHADAPTATFASTATLPTGTGTTPVRAAKPFSFSSLFDINNILTSEPVAALFNTFGVNITERVQTVLEQKLWDDRIQLITDHNYDDLIVNEPMTSEEEQERVWIFVITVTASKQDGISKFLDNVFDTAYNESQLAGDLPHVRWGRIDYLNVTYVTTKWAVWQAPYLVIATDRGQNLRFYRPHNIRVNADAIREFLKVEGWKATPAWSSPYSPGGSREWFMDFQAKWFTLFYDWFIMVPKWILLLVSGTLASTLIGLMHRGSETTTKPAAKPAAKPIASTSSAPVAPSKSGKSKAATPATATDSEREASAPPAKRTSARQRKPAKK